jgi:predicted phage terminase large subunit-like protein
MARPPKFDDSFSADFPEGLPGMMLAEDLAEFTRQAWTVLNPSRELAWSWHYDLLCERLTLVKMGVLRRLIINVPPRTLKSTLVTIIYPVWVWLTEPSHQFMAASYNSDLSEEHSLKRRNLLQSPWFARVSGNRVRLRGGRNRVDQFTNDKGGHMISASVGATAWGRGCDTAIIDDPLSAAQAFSDAERPYANNWIDSVLRSRHNDPGKGNIILVMQRLHQMDLTGYLLEHEPSLWIHDRIPLVAEEDEKWSFPITGRIVERKEGDVLLPGRFTPKVVEELRTRRMVFAGQYQQRPAPADGNYIKCHDIRYYGGIDPKTGQPDEPPPRTFDQKIVSVDCSYKTSAHSDFVAIGVIGVKGQKRYVIHVTNKRLDVAATVTEITNLCQCHQYVRAVLIEDAANGQAVIQLLQQHLCRVIPIQPRGGKTSRMHAAAAEWQAGDWHIDRYAAWAEPFLEQLMLFPNAAHDDQVDMMSQASVWLAENTHRAPVWRVTNAFTGDLIYEA